METHRHRSWNRSEMAMAISAAVSALALVYTVYRDIKNQQIIMAQNQVIIDNQNALNEIIIPEEEGEETEEYT